LPPFSNPLLSFSTPPAAPLPLRPTVLVFEDLKSKALLAELSPRAW
jgi:hypothetical protein